MVKIGGDFAKIFGDGSDHVKTAGDIVSTGVLKMKTIDDNGVHQSLAPSFGDESKLGDLKKLDDALKVFIAVINRRILQIPENQRSWDTIQALFLKEVISTPKGDPVVITPPDYTKNDTHWFKTDGSPDSKTVDEVLKWWATKAVPDEDIRKDTKINIKELANIVAWTGATVTNFWDFWSKTEYHSKTVLDVGVLRYPNPNEPYFKVYRLQVTAFSDCTRHGFYQDDTNGITSNLTYRCFLPNDENINKLSKETRDKAIKEIDKLFPED